MSMIYLGSLLFHIAFYGGTIVIALLASPLLLAPPAAARFMGRFWGIYALATLKLARIGYETQGDMRRDEQVIYAVKHQSAFETMTLFHLLDAPVVVLKIELTRLPVIGQFLRRAGVIAVDRSAGMAALKKMRHEAEASAKTGRSILIFPQGTRVAFGEAAPYQVGIFALYEATGLPVVPVALDSGRFWPRRSLWLYPGKVQFRYLPPIAPGLARKPFMQALETAIEDEMQQLERSADKGER